MNLSQMGPLRPTKSLAGYRTPVARLWHTAAGAHPMGALNGWSGRTTARTVDRLLRRQRQQPEPRSVYVPPADAVADRPLERSAV
jgi:phytoene dehydrogenase-like protein